MMAINWAEALQGAGAGLQGQLPQWRAANAAKEKAALEAEEARRLAFFQDNRMAMIHLLQGNTGRALELLGNRRDYIGKMPPSQSMGAGSGDTDYLINLIQSDPEAALAEMKSADEVAVSMGLVDKMGGDANIQFGAGVTAKDAKGDLYRVVTINDPNTGKTKEVVSGIGHDREHDGRLTLVAPNSGQTPEEKLNYNAENEWRTANAATRGKMYEEAIGQLMTFRSTMDSYDQAIVLLNQGADTGALDEYLMDMRASTIALRNVQTMLGLDVLNLAKLTPVSDTEIKLAMTAGMPMNMQPEDLKKWLEAKKQSTMRIYNYTYDLANHLGSGGSLNGWMNAQKDRSSSQGRLPPPAYNDKGWKLMTDKDGNQAYVGPGENDIEEVAE